MDLAPDQLAKAERLWQELLAEHQACKRLQNDLDTRHMRIQAITDELGEFIPRPAVKLCSCQWGARGMLRTYTDPLCAIHGHQQRSA